MTKPRIFDGKSHTTDQGVNAKHSHHTMHFVRKGLGVIEREVDHDYGKVIISYRHTLSTNGRQNRNSKLPYSRSAERSPSKTSSRFTNEEALVLRAVARLSNVRRDGLFVPRSNWPIYVGW